MENVITKCKQYMNQANLYDINMTIYEIINTFINRVFHIVKSIWDLKSINMLYLGND